jgi:hyperosmotically inducible periplasmic protein
MRITKKLISLTGCCTFALGLALAQVQPDNTKMNKGDGSKGAVTADQQKMNLSDRQVTQQVRKAVIADKGLSTYAHNIKIITQNGKVTLKGPVRSEEEKQSIASKAESIAGAGKIDNELTVKAGSTK